MPDYRQHLSASGSKLSYVTNCFDGIVDRYLSAADQFEVRVRAVRPDWWTLPTPCSAWDVRALVNHVTLGNLNYVGLAEGGTGAEFIRLRDADALGADPVAAYAESVRLCAETFSRPGILGNDLDYPLGTISGRQALAVRTTDTVVHTWDLARAIGADDRLDETLIAWIDTNLTEIYAGLAETPTATDTTHRFFDAPEVAPLRGGTRQDRLLLRMGRRPV